MSAAQEVERVNRRPSSDSRGVVTDSSSANSTGPRSTPPRYDKNPKVRVRQYEDRVLPPVPLELIWPSIAFLVAPVASIDVHTESQTT